MLIFLNLPPTPCLFMCVSTHSLHGMYVYFPCTLCTKSVLRLVAVVALTYTIHTVCTNCTQTEHHLRYTRIRTGGRVRRVPLDRELDKSSNASYTEVISTQWNVCSRLDQSVWPCIRRLSDLRIPHFPPFFCPLAKFLRDRPQSKVKKATTNSYTKIIGLDRCQW